MDLSEQNKLKSQKPMVDPEVEANREAHRIELEAALEEASPSSIFSTMFGKPKPVAEGFKVNKDGQLPPLKRAR